MADELAALLDTAAVPEPYVIVGHSNGGMVAQLFAGAHPHQVAGIVLVDTAHEDQDLRAAELVRRQLPPDQADALIAGMTAMPPRLVDPEQFDATASRDQLRASRTTAPLPAVPMAVLVHGLPLGNIPPQLAELYEPIWQQMQREVAALVPGASYQVVADTTHDIHHDRPDVVADTIIEHRHRRPNPHERTLIMPVCTIPVAAVDGRPIGDHRHNGRSVRAGCAQAVRYWRTWRRCSWLGG